jgi:hypothetical protein
VKNRLAVVASGRAARALCAAAILLASASAALGRQIPPSTPRRDPEVERIRDQKRREMQLRNLGESPERATDEQAVKAAVKQLNQDFQRIQVIRNEVARSLKRRSGLDYDRVAEQAAEVRKRALRMQGYLALTPRPEAGAGEPPRTEAHGGHLYGALVRLCKLIDSFVASPRFKSPGVVDVEADAKAGRDLREIISLSADIKESAGRRGLPAAPAAGAGP